MKSIEFDALNPKKNRVMLNNLIGESEIEDIDLVEVIDLDTHDDLLADVELDESDIKFYYFLSQKIANGEREFLVDDKVKDVALTYFGQVAWEKGKNVHVKTLKQNGELEIRLE